MGASPRLTGQLRLVRARVTSSRCQELRRLVNYQVLVSGNRTKPQDSKVQIANISRAFQLWGGHIIF